MVYNHWCLGSWNLCGAKNVRLCLFVLLQSGHKAKASKCSSKSSSNSASQSEAMQKVAASCASQLSQVNKDIPSANTQHTSVVPAGPEVLVSKSEDQEVRSVEGAELDVKTGASRETSDVWHQLWLLTRVRVVDGPLFLQCFWTFGFRLYGFSKHNCL